MCISVSWSKASNAALEQRDKQVPLGFRHGLETVSCLDAKGPRITIKRRFCRQAGLQSAWRRGVLLIQQVARPQCQRQRTRGQTSQIYAGIDQIVARQ